MFKKILFTLPILIGLLASCASPAPIETPNPVKPETVPSDTPEPSSEVNLGQTASFEESACPVDLPPGAVEGEHIRCGYVNVPEERFGESGNSPNTLRLAVAVIASTSEDPAADPLVMLAGGPGQSAFEAFIPLLAAPGMERFRADREIVLIEQRGTLYSTPFLKCEEMSQFKLEILAQNLSGEAEDELRLEALSACRDRWIESGVSLGAYNSLENAADIIDVLDGLGYDQFNIYGGSYGSLLAQHILRDYPDRVRSAILDSVSPLRHEPNMLYKAHSMDAALRMLFAQCQADTKCNEFYPDLESVYFDLVDQLNQAPVTIQIKDNKSGEEYDILLNGDRLISITRDLLYLTAVLPDMPKAIYSMSKGDFSLIETIQSLTLSQLTLADGMYNSVVCTELSDFNSTDFADTNNLYPQVAEVVENLIIDVMLQPCQVWNVDLLDASLMKSLTGSTPVLLTSGEFDPTVPPIVAQIAAENLTRAYTYTFPGVGHGVLATSECATSIMLDFLHQPDQEPDASCLETMPKLTFRYPAGITQLEAFTNEGLGLQGLVPSGWTEIQTGVYARMSSAVDPTALQIVLDKNASVQEILVDISSSYGQAEPPEPTSRHEANGLEWSLYAFEVQGYPWDLALAQSDLGSLILLISSSPEEHTAIYKDVFLPMVDALSPLTGASDQSENEAPVEGAFEPFSDPTMGIQGLTPTGWGKAGPGTFARGDSTDDITVLLMQAAPVTAQDLLTTLSGQLGLSALPEVVGEQQANNLAWTFYVIQIDEVVRDIALAENEGVAYIIILRSAAAERPDLYETIFIPTVEALTGME